MTIWNPGSTVVIVGDFLPPVTAVSSLGSAAFKWQHLYCSGNININGNLTTDGNTTLGDAAGDALTIAPNTVTWTNNPTHSGNHIFNGNVTVKGASQQYGDGTADVIDIANGTIHTDGGGKVGIGTNTPAAKLHTLDSVDVEHRIESSGPNNVWTRFKNTIRQWTVGINASGLFQINDATAGQIALLIDTNRNWSINNAGIGTTAVNVVGIANGTAPTTSPAGGGQLYVLAGALRYRGSAGTDSLVAAA